ncbi:MAG: Gx transporter family protein [Endomicrobia bacterium]|nr:Gx transporter family protein [Endomicrobiia bacterium]
MLTDKKITNLILLASSLQVLESYFPHPIPGVRLGLANFVSLITIIKFGIVDAVKVTIFRTICSSVFLGSFLSVSFILSFVSGLTSTVVMWIVYSTFNKILKFSTLGISVTGAVVHNLTQLVVIYLLFIRQQEIFYLTPVLLLSAIIAGIITGSVSLSVLKEFSDKLSCKPNYCVEEINVLIHNEPKMKRFKILILSIMLLLCIPIYVFHNLNIQVFSTIFLLLIYFLTSGSIMNLYNNLLRVKWLIFSSIFIPLIFSRSGEIIFTFNRIPLLTKNSINIAINYSLRILAITIISSYFTQKFKKEEVIYVFNRLLFFHRDAGNIIAEILLKFPNFMERLKTELSMIKCKSAKDLYNSIGTYIVKLINESDIVCL